VISASYMQTAPLRIIVDHGGIRLTFHSEHRPLESFTRAVEASGLLIETISEVKPSDHLAGGEVAGYTKLLTDSRN
jgi:hypothetical protein